jgi:hypothetical protein
MKASSFVPGTIIRDIKTKHPYMVIQRLSHAILIVDILSRETVQNMKVILRRDYDQFADDLEFDCKTTGSNGHTRVFFEEASYL